METEGGGRKGDEGRKSLRGMEERRKGEENEVNYGGRRGGSRKELRELKRNGGEMEGKRKVRGERK
jgi:hypothetical protein